MATNTQKGVTNLQQKQQERLKNQYTGSYIKTPTAKVVTPVNANSVKTPLPAPVQTLPQPPVDFSTTVRERADALIQQEAYDKPANFAEEIGFSKEDLPSSLDQQVKDLKQRQLDQLNLAKQQAELATRLETENVSQARRAGAGAIAASDVALTAGREEAQSAGNLQVASAFERETQRKVNNLADQANSARLAREQALKDLEQAQKEGRAEFAKSALNRLANAETEIKKIDTELLNAQREQSEEARAIQAAARANLESFSNVISAGIKLDNAGLKNLASSLNVPLELALDYYDGAQLIRDDKTLDAQEKAVKLNDLKVDLQRKKAGLDDVKARQIDYLATLRQRGATQDEISAYKQLVGITDYDDPLTKAELSIKQAEAKIKDAEARGEVINPLDRLELAKGYAELSEQSGGNGVYEPTSSKYAVEASDNGLFIGVQNGEKLARGQCGEFVNDVLGIGVGDTLASKTKFIDNTVVYPSPGMAFVSSRGYDLGAGKGNSGHIGIVESVNPDGTFNTVESNYNGDERVSRRQNVPVTEVVGFIRPSKAKLLEKGNVSGAIEATGLLTDLGGTETERKNIVNLISQKIKNGEAKDVAEAKRQLKIITKTDLEIQKTAKEEIKPAREQYNEINLKLQAIPQFVSSPNAIGDVAVVVNFLKTIDPSSVARETEVAGVENARGIVSSVGNYFNKLQTGEKLSKSQRKEIASVANILSRVAADSYYKQLLERSEEIKARGIEPTFASKSEITSLERLLGAKRINAIKQDLGIVSPRYTPKIDQKSAPTLSKFNIQLDLDTLIDE